MLVPSCCRSALVGAGCALDAAASAAPFFALYVIPLETSSVAVQASRFFAAAAFLAAALSSGVMLANLAFAAALAAFASSVCILESGFMSLSSAIADTEPKANALAQSATSSFFMSYSSTVDSDSIADACRHQWQSVAIASDEKKQGPQPLPLSKRCNGLLTGRSLLVHARAHLLTFRLGRHGLRLGRRGILFGLRSSELHILGRDHVERRCVSQSLRARGFPGGSLLFRCHGRPLGLRRGPGRFRILGLHLRERLHVITSQRRHGTEGECAGAQCNDQLVHVMFLNGWFGWLCSFSACLNG